MKDVLYCTAQSYGLKLKEKIAKNESIYDIAQWSGAVLNEQDVNCDKDFYNILLKVSMMSADEEFEYNYEYLKKIADKLVKD